jgi:hypothetical protein
MSNVGDKEDHRLKCQMKIFFGFDMHSGKQKKDQVIGLIWKRKLLRITLIFLKTLNFKAG